MMDLQKRIEAYLRQLAPHQKEREAASLLRESASRIEELENQVKSMWHTIDLANEQITEQERKLAEQQVLINAIQEQHYVDSDGWCPTCKKTTDGKCNVNIPASSAEELTKLLSEAEQRGYQKGCDAKQLEFSHLAPDGYKFIVWDGRKRVEVLAIDYIPQQHPVYGMEEIRGKEPLILQPNAPATKGEGE